MWFKLFLTVTLINILTLRPSDAHSSECFYKRCMGCSEVAASSIGMPVQCDLRNIVTPQWAHNLGYDPPVNSAQYAIEYRCLKMISTPDDQTWGQTTDIIRGCVPLAQVESTCAALSAIQKARGQSDVRCRTCNGNLCNAASSIRTTEILLFLMLLQFFQHTYFNLQFLNVN